MGCESNHYILDIRYIQSGTNVAKEEIHDRFILYIINYTITI